jgi:replication-associated recombination protein RarA
LDEVIGNTPIKKVIFDMAKNSSFAPILFEGVRGCGKTTLGYIVATLFGADPSNVDRVNCFAEGVDQMRERLDNLNKTSFFGKRKVLILDEIHGLSKQGQQVFLTPLEELNKDSLIIACTTTTEQVNKALLDRFKRLKVMPLNDDDAISLLKLIAQKENIKIPKWKMALLLEKCNGIPRLLLSGLDKIRNIDDDKEAAFLLELNELSEENPEVLELFKLILARTSWDIIRNKLKNMLKELSPETIRVGLCGILTGRLLSDYGTITEKEMLSNLYDKYLKNPISYPERSNLINIVFLLRKGV